MVELLIAIIIIGILVTIIVPVLSNRAADARLAAAQADLEAIANAQSQVALDTGYIVRLHVLDDSAAASDGAASSDPDDVVDTVVDEVNNVGPGGAGNPGQIFLDAKNGVIMPINLYDRLIAGPEQFGWRGPYVNFQRKLRQTTPAVVFPPNGEWTFGTPLDPWGNPYFLFVAGLDSGVGGSSNGRWVNERTGTLDTQFSFNGFNSDAQRFDRNTVLSLGPDGVAGAGGATELGTGDDIYRSF